MKEFSIRAEDAGQRMDRFCERILKEAPKSFFFKMFRKKNITLNGKKVSGNERLEVSDVVRFYLSDETFEKFKGKQETSQKPEEHLPDPKIVYEDPNVLVVYKPAGMLSQKATKSDLSMNEYCLSYLEKNGVYDRKDPAAFKPSVCNRLDRNTSGLLLVAKTLGSARLLSDLLKNRKIGKYYVCVVKGILKKPFTLQGYLKKDPKTNTVQILQKHSEGASPVETVFEPIRSSKNLTLLNVHLITGKTHQIRAHLKSIGHPILGDPKYGDPVLNRNHHCRGQMLCAWRIEMPKLEKPFEDLSMRTIEISIPQDFLNALDSKKEG